MSGACRLGDHAKVPLDHHHPGCVACPHPNAEGPAVTGSFNVKINGVPALRKNDVGIHAACCGLNVWKVHRASGQVIVNGHPLVRKGDPTDHCGGRGHMIGASGNVVDRSGQGPPRGVTIDRSEKAEAAEAEEGSLREGIIQWLDRIRENGIAELLRMVSPALGDAYFGAGEFAKLLDPECRGIKFLQNLGKCLPSNPPGWDERRGPPPPPPPHPVPVVRRGPNPDIIEPVGFWDPDNPITGLALLAAGGAGGIVRGGEVAIEGGGAAVRGGVSAGGAAVRAGVSAGKWAGEKLGGAVSGAGKAVTGPLHAFGVS